MLRVGLKIISLYASNEELQGIAKSSLRCLIFSKFDMKPI